MNLKKGIGKTGVALAIIIAIALCLLNYLFHPVDIAPIEYGICLPSPDAWNGAPFLSWLINTVLIGIVALLLWLINRSYNFIRTTEPALVPVFLIMACSSAWFTQSLNTSVILCLANIVSLGIIFTTYDTRNATQQMFIIGVVIGIGSMFQYAFLPMAFVYFLWSLFMKVMRIKETLAYLGGILCPYWIVLGIGWLSFSDIHYPSLNPFFGMTKDLSDIWVLFIGIGFAVCLGFLVTVVNTFKLYAGNSKVNAMNMCVSTLGAGAVVCILVDYDNLTAYTVTLYMACAVQIANINALWNPKFPWMPAVLPSLFYIALFVCGILF